MTMKNSNFNFTVARVSLALVAALFITAAQAFSQDAAPPSTPAEPSTTAQQPIPVAATIKKESRLVLVDAVVTDKKGNYVHDLSQGDFKVFEDNNEQAITSFSSGADVASPQNPQKH